MAAGGAAIKRLVLLLEMISADGARETEAADAYVASPNGGDGIEISVAEDDNVGTTSEDIDDPVVDDDDDDDDEDDEDDADEDDDDASDTEGIVTVAAFLLVVAVAANTSSQLGLQNFELRCRFRLL
uniref:Putative pheromone-processing carboxypeptidase kex1 n=1 Tax=Anopheles triannulatus TaxID=58253 RepID=A0A2M4B4K1_9DIPT